MCKRKHRTHEKEEQKRPQKAKTPAAGLTGLTGGEPVTAVNYDDLQTQTARLGDTRLQTVQRQALATKIGREQGNRYLHRVLTPLTEKRGQGIIQRYIIRPPRLQIRNGQVWGGEAYHLYKDRDRSESLRLERLLTNSERGEMGSAIQDSEIQLMLNQIEQLRPNGVTVVHRVERILPGELNGQTLRPRDSPRLSDNRIDVAIADSGASRFQSVLWHELFHAFHDVLLTFESRQPRSYRRGRNPLRLPFAHDLVEALMWPSMNRLARAVRANQPYQFGWFENPESHVWLNLRNPRALGELERSSSNTRISQATRNGCEQLLRTLRPIVTGGGYEQGFRYLENPEEDMAESFERYQEDATAMSQSHPLRYALLSQYFRILRQP